MTFFISTWSVYLVTPAHQCGTLFQAHFTVLHQLVHVGLVVLGPMVRRAVQRIPNLHLFDLLHLAWKREGEGMMRRREKKKEK